MRSSRRHIRLSGTARIERLEYLPRTGALTGQGLSERTLHGSGNGRARRSRLASEGGRSGRRALIAGAIAVIVVLAGTVAAFATSQVSIGIGASSLATVAMPLGGGRIVDAGVYRGAHEQSIPIRIAGDQLWPKRQIAAGEQLVIEVLVKRPSWIGWLAGETERRRIHMVAPSALLQSSYLTLASGQRLQASFNRPVASLYYGTQPGKLRRASLASPSRSIVLPRSGPAGSLMISAAPFSWETATPVSISWFPPGASSDAIATPAPGSQIGPATPIVLTFSKPVDAALGSSMPVLQPSASGSWKTIGAHTIEFVPSGAGYGLGAKVTIGLPGGVNLIGGSSGSPAATANWSVPAGSTMRLQQLLAQLGYLPLEFHSNATVQGSPAAEEQAAIHPPAGSFEWRYGNVPSALRSDWEPGASGVMTRGALMAFESEHEMTADGIAGSAVWRALIAASIAHQRSSFGYTYVSVSKSAQRLTLWHDGRDVLSTAVNTGIAASPTEAGTFPVYEHLRSTTMSGTNPNGSHYEDPGVPWVSYFNGGDALHGFERAQYGFPQSLGCVEMPPATAGQVWPYTPIGTLVHVEE